MHLLIFGQPREFQNSIPSGLIDISWMPKCTTSQNESSFSKLALLLSCLPQWMVPSFHHFSEQKPFFFHISRSCLTFKVSSNCPLHFHQYHLKTTTILLYIELFIYLFFVNPHRLVASHILPDWGHGSNVQPRYIHALDQNWTQNPSVLTPKL